VRIGRKAVPVGKISLLIVLLLVGLLLVGCYGVSSSPSGGSGATVTEETIFLAPSIKQSGGAFSCSSSTSEGKLVAINAETGVQRWEVTLTGATQSGGFGCSSGAVPVAVYGSPALSGELVYVAGYNGKVYALNAESGALRWVYPREGNMDPIVSGLVVVLDKLFFGCADGKVYALDAATGDLLWEFATESEDKIWSTPTLDGETLYVASLDKKLYALNAADGTEIWQFEAEGAIASTPLVDNGTIYIGGLDRYFYAIDAADGTEIWKFQAEKWFWTRAVIVEDAIYVGCFDGKAYVLNALNGNEITEFDLESPARSWPVLVENRVLIATEAGKIFTIDTVNNQLGLFADLEETIYAPLALNGGVLYVYTQEQNLHAFNTDTGVKLWVQSFK
jgi:outer membrane protein assembly factor BamB